MDYEIDLSKKLIKPIFKVLDNRPICVGDKIICVMNDGFCIDETITGFLMDEAVVGTVIKIDELDDWDEYEKKLRPYHKIFARWNVSFDVDDLYNENGKYVEIFYSGKDDDEVLNNLADASYYLYENMVAVIE